VKEATEFAELRALFGSARPNRFRLTAAVCPRCDGLVVRVYQTPSGPIAVFAALDSAEPESVGPSTFRVVPHEDDDGVFVDLTAGKPIYPDGRPPQHRHRGVQLAVNLGDDRAAAGWIAAECECQRHPIRLSDLRAAVREGRKRFVVS
jgi:hypothetical protein